MTIEQLSLGGSTQIEKIDYVPMYAGPVTDNINGGKTFETFNADLSRGELYMTPKTVTIEDTASMASNYRYAAQLYNAFEPTVGTNAVDNAALQVAIWVALYPSLIYSDYGPTGVTAQANDYLSQNVSGESDKASFYNFGEHNASQIGALATPEPSSVGCLAVGALGLALRRLRK